jgi:hypothetical protein
VSGLRAERTIFPADGTLRFERTIHVVQSLAMPAAFPSLVAAHPADALLQFLCSQLHHRLHEVTSQHSHIRRYTTQDVNEVIEISFISRQALCLIPRVAQAQTHNLRRRQLRPCLQITVVVNRIPARVGDVVEAIADNDTVGRIAQGWRGPFNDLL